MFSQGDTQTIPVAADADSYSFFQTGHISFPCFWKIPLGQPCTWSLLPAPLKTSPPLTGSAQLAKSGRGQVTNPLWPGQGNTRVKQHTPVTHWAVGIHSLTTHWIAPSCRNTKVFYVAYYGFFISHFIWIYFYINLLITRGMKRKRQRVFQRTKKIVSFECQRMPCLQGSCWLNFTTEAGISYSDTKIHLKI